MSDELVDSIANVISAKLLNSCRLCCKIDKCKSRFNYEHTGALIQCISGLCASTSTSQEINCRSSLKAFHECYTGRHLSFAV